MGAIEAVFEVSLIRRRIHYRGRFCVFLGTHCAYQIDSGQWLASQTSRPDLPWTFGVIDTLEVNAFAAPGGFILVTRGMYELLSSDSELAAVLANEIGHCVQRDHYNVIRKQQLASTGKDLALAQVSTGNDTVAGSYARRYAEQYGAAVMFTALGSKSAMLAQLVKRIRRSMRAWIASIGMATARWRVTPSAGERRRSPPPRSPRLP